ncbi:hypothetical protein F8M41_020914 [Gigaspora margarita]|uniref:Uncharacterized protein n=1 Tax=Gigaspora margarita TaxID=4874 RepID=A0A8H4EJE8_GIGMA|nr:hypothetical protein F8M41_020914 [Gigaspora margarita]
MPVEKKEKKVKAKKSLFVKQKTGFTNSKLLVTGSCNIGYCGDKDYLNACNAKCEVGVKIERIVLGAHHENNKTFYFDTLSTRLFCHRFTNFELQDISIHLKFTTYDSNLQENNLIFQ